jgi:hypothetical protein
MYVRTCWGTISKWCVYMYVYHVKYILVFLVFSLFSTYTNMEDWHGLYLTKSCECIFVCTLSYVHVNIQQKTDIVLSWTRPVKVAGERTEMPVEVKSLHQGSKAYCQNKCVCMYIHIYTYITYLFTHVRSEDAFWENTYWFQWKWVLFAYRQSSPSIYIRIWIIPWVHAYSLDEAELSACMVYHGFKSHVRIHACICIYIHTRTYARAISVCMWITMHTQTYTQHTHKHRAGTHMSGRSFQGKGL